jgi:hypothetical protein
VPQLLLAIQDDPSHPNAHRYLAACYAHMVGSMKRERWSRDCAPCPLS